MNNACSSLFGDCWMLCGVLRCCMMVVGCDLSLTFVDSCVFLGCLLFVVGCWLLVVGDWSLVVVVCLLLAACCS